MQRDMKHCLRTVSVCTALVLALIMPTTIVQAQSGQTPFIGDPNERTFVLTARLYGNPDDKNVLGSLVLRLSQAVGNPDDFNAIGLAHLLQMEEPFIGGAIFDAAGVAVINFARPEIESGNASFFTLSTTISSSLAARMIGDPNIFTAVFFTTSGPAVAGQLQIGNPED